jgi:predicted metal-dependent TIM-barrel fold hydrolase
MKYVEIHAHMVSRTTDDYYQLALTGCVALTEPAFWAGYDRGSAAAFADYFEQLTAVEPKRAAKFGIQHFTWLCLNPKEAEDRSLTREVLAIIPRYLDRPTVLGIGEIGLNRVTRNELEGFVEHVDLAVAHDQLIHIHTPHLEDKYKGTKVIVDTLAADGQVQPGRVMVDHLEEHTIGMVLDNGFWAGITLYPTTKMSPGRAIDMIEQYGSDRVCLGSACDWGPSVPVAIPQLIVEMRRRGHSEALIRKIVWDNPIAFLGQCDKFRLDPRHLTTPATSPVAVPV